MNSITKIKNTSVTIILFLSFTFAFIEGIKIGFAESTDKVSESSNESETSQSSSVQSSSSELVSSNELSSDASLSTVTEEENIIPYSQIQDLLYENVKQILDPIAEDSWDKFSDVMLALDKFITFSKDHEAISEDKKILISLLLLDNAVENELFEDSSVKDSVLEIENELSLQLESFEKAKYNDEVYNNFINSSQEFSKLGKKTEMVLSRQVIFVGEDFILQKAPIKYDDHILISLDDVLKYTNATVQSDEKNCTFALQTNKVLLEFSRGSNVCYVNDKTSNMEVPTLYFNDTVYISAEFFAQTYGIQYKYMSENGIIIFYGKK